MKTKLYNTDTTTRIAQVQNIQRGEYVRRISKDGRMQAATYTRSYYDAETKRYALDDTSDISRQVFVKKGTRLAIGFTY